MEYIKHPETNNTSSGLPIYDFYLSENDSVDALPTETDKKEFIEKVAAGSVAVNPNCSAVFLLSESGWNQIA